MLEGLIPSVGTVGDALDNALCETTIGLYKTECIREGSPFRCVLNAEGSVRCRQCFLKWCCAGDEGLLALRSRPAGGGFKPPHAAGAVTRLW